MSHRWNCPTDYEAEYQGRRAAENGRSRYSNPHEGFGDDACPDASEAWQRGYRREQYEIEQRAEQTAYEQRRERRMREEEAQQQEEYYAILQAEEQAEMQRQYEADMMAAEQGNNPA